MTARRWRLIALCCCGIALAACGDRRPRAVHPTDRADSTAAPALPRPQHAGGSVTGMPDSRSAPPALPPPSTAPEPIVDPAPTAAPELTADAAVAVLRDYYAAINGGDYRHAWRLWDDDGRASGQSAEQFVAGFADTLGMSVEIGRPDEIDAGAGQRRVRVPVVVTATLRDGRTQRYIGDYLLHAWAVEDAPPGWRIQDGTLRLQK